MPYIKISPWLPVGLCLFYYLDPWGCFLPFLLAVITHELGHILAVISLGERVTALTLRLGGAALETSPLSYRKELLCSLTGPVSGLLVGCLFRKYYPWFWYWTALHSAYNLLPIYPLDGGRALRAFLCQNIPLNKADTLCRIISAVFFLAFTLFCLLFPLPGIPFLWRVFPPILLFLQVFP